MFEGMITTMKEGNILWREERYLGCCDENIFFWIWQVMGTFLTALGFGVFGLLDVCLVGIIVPQTCGFVG